MRREGKKLREAEANLKGVVTMRLESAKWLADDFDEAAARLTALSARNAVVEEAAKALIADVRRRYPGEELRCEYLRALDAALTTKETDDGE
jgi:hypothetical protein